MLAVRSNQSSIWDHYLHANLLILDDFCLHPIAPPQATVLWKLVDALQGRASLIVCSQGTPANWHAQLGGGITVKTIINRIVNNSVSTLHIPCESMSMREYSGPKNC